MKETVAQFEERTGARYVPPRSLRAHGLPLGAREACPTLFRFPAPETLAALLSGARPRLAPDDRDFVWLASTIAGTERPGAARAFGVVAVVQPLALGIVKSDQRGIYLAPNVAPSRDLVLWAPPRALKAGFGWDRIADGAQLTRKLGKHLNDERARTLDALGGYLEELAELQKSGAPAPKRPWSELPVTSRRKLLAEAGVQSRWTPRR